MSNVDPDALAAINALRTELVGHLGEINVALNGLSDRVSALEEPPPVVVPPHGDEHPLVVAEHPTPAHTPAHRDDLLGANVGPQRSDLTDEGYLKITQPGVYDGVSANFVRINCSGVTLRNFKVVTGDINVHAINVADGVTDVTIEDGIIDMSNSPRINSGCYGGSNITMRRVHISGNGDGFKCQPDSLYEDLFVHVFKPAGSLKHCDAAQSSGSSGWTLRRSTLRAMPDDGGNSAALVQCFDGREYHPVKGCLIEDCDIDGGNYTLFALRGHRNSEESDRAAAASDPIKVVNTVFGGHHRYGDITGKVELVGCTHPDGSPVTA